MGFIKRTSLLLVCLCAQYASAVTLAQFQDISSFPPICTAVWNTPIPGCTHQDFADGQPCSGACIQGLKVLTVTLNQACAGTRAGSDTLIGLFFQKQGVSTLCPNLVSISSTTETSDESSTETQTTTAAGTMDILPGETATSVALDPSTTEGPAEIQNTQTQGVIPASSSSSSSFSQLARTSTTSTTHTTATTSSSETSTTSRSSASRTTTETSTARQTGDSTLQITFDGTTTATPTGPDSSQSTSSTTSPLGSSETEGFWGFGNAFDILAGGAPSGREGCQRCLIAGIAFVTWLSGVSW